jgi:hypothetical protein
MMKEQRVTAESSKRSLPSRHEPTIADAIAKIVPSPRNRVKPAKEVRWAVGITTAPRLGGKEYLSETLKAVLAAGFEKEDILVAAEPRSPVPSWWEEMGGAVTRRGKRMGVFPNHFATLHELRFGCELQKSDAFLMLECDARPCPGLREYLERFVLWPVHPNQLSCVSLYTCAIYGGSTRGWYEWSRPGFWAAQALLFSKESAAQYLTGNPFAYRHIESPVAYQNRFADSEVSQWAHAMSRPIHFAVGHEGASLIEHVGESSSVFNRDELSGSRKEWWSVRAALAGEAPPDRQCPYSPARWLVDTPRQNPPMQAPRAPTIPGETTEARRVRRLAICEQCDEWHGAPVKEDQCHKCASCGVRKRSNLGDVNLYCPMNLPGWQ